MSLEEETASWQRRQAGLVWLAEEKAAALAWGWHQGRERREAGRQLSGLLGELAESLASCLALKHESAAGLALLLLYEQTRIW